MKVYLIEEKPHCNTNLFNATMIDLRRDRGNETELIDPAGCIDSESVCRQCWPEPRLSRASKRCWRAVIVDRLSEGSRAPGSGYSIAFETRPRVPVPSATRCYALIRFSAKDNVCPRKYCNNQWLIRCRYRACTGETKRNCLRETWTRASVREERGNNWIWSVIRGKWIDPTILFSIKLLIFLFIHRKSIPLNRIAKQWPYKSYNILQIVIIHIHIAQDTY